jgi:hypothetical protein
MRSKVLATFGEVPAPSGLGEHYKLRALPSDRMRRADEARYRSA